MKTRKSLALALALIAFISLLSGCAVFGSEPDVKYKEIDGEIHVTGYTDKTVVTDLTIPDEVDGKKVTVIEDFGVVNAESLTKITIGKNVREIGPWGLTNNQHLAAFEVDPENEYFTARDGVLFSKDMKTLYCYPCGKGVTFDRFGQAATDADGNVIATQYAIPEGVEVIREKAFYKCYYVNVTAFPDSITRIEEKAFHRTSSLLDFTMPAHLEYIGKDAFAYDDKLTDLTIPATIREIGEYAFFNCTGMVRLAVLAKEADMTLGTKWMPTEKGRVRTECEVTFAE